jgi:hypothetical protein
MLHDLVVTGGVRHSSSDVSINDQWRWCRCMVGSKWEMDRIGSGCSQPGEETGAGAAGAEAGLGHNLSHTPGHVEPWSQALGVEASLEV